MVVLMVGALGLALAGPTGLAGRVVAAVGGHNGAPTIGSGPLPACRADEILTEDRTPADWARTFLDPSFGLEPDNVPQDLVPIGEAAVRRVGSVRPLVVDDLRALVASARRDGVTLRVRSAFRSYDEQVTTFA
ncbi:MAG: zinc D-Ala-D-Ala carboxypeptidase, partial [Chloroflexota bacterium]|nr:zinc D-Ala-D-Ala carboxypeptidase [Chloroflexota bacterium]